MQLFMRACLSFYASLASSNIALQPSTQWAPVIFEKVSQRIRWSATSFIGAHPGPPRVWMASSISNVSFPRNGGGAGLCSAGGGAGAAVGAAASADVKMFGPLC